MKSKQPTNKEERKTMKPNILITIAITTILTAVTANAKEKAHTMDKDPMTQELQSLKGAEFEIGYLADMIHHHKSGVEMAKLVAKRSKRSELHKLAEKILSAQHKEIEQMTGWLKDWHNKTPKDHSEPAAHKKMMQKDMAKLEAAKGAEFDKMFLIMMSEHHQGAVSMSKLVDERSNKSELKKLAKKITASQSQEIEQMADWQKEWFGSDKAAEKSHYKP